MNRRPTVVKFLCITILFKARSGKVGKLTRAIANTPAQGHTAWSKSPWRFLQEEEIVKPLLLDCGALSVHAAKRCAVGAGDYRQMLGDCKRADTRPVR